MIYICMLKLVKFFSCYKSKFFRLKLIFRLTQSDPNESRSNRTDLNKCS